MADIQGTDGLEPIIERGPASIGDQIVEASASEFRSLVGSFVETAMVLEIAAHDLNVASRELFCHSLLSGLLVTDETNDLVL